MIAKRLQEGVTRVLKGALVALMAAMAIVIILQVFSRYVLGQSIPWTEELGRYLLIYMTFIGSSVAVYERAHLKVDFLILKLPIAVQKVISIVTNLLLIIAAGCLLFYGDKFTSLSAGTISPALEQSMAWIYASMPIAGLLMILYLVPQVIDQVVNWRTNVPEQASHAPHLTDV